MINLRLDGAVRTLILTLRARADEQDHDAPLFSDPWSAEWYQFMPEIKAIDDWYNPRFQLATAIRSRLIDEAVDAFIASHDNPLVVELGAGFSTRYFRVGEGKSTWIELDFPEAIIARRKLDIEVDNHWFIASDMTEMDWIDLLPDVDPENTLFIAEGSLMFIDQKSITALMDTLADRFAGATFVFDVVNPEYIEQTNDNFSALNAPMQWGVYEDQLENYGLTISDARYLLLEFPDRWDALNVDSKNRTQERSGYVIAATLG